MTDNTKKIFTVACILILLAIASLYLVIRSESAKITTFEECEKAGWLVSSIRVYDSVGGYCSIEKECMLWSGKSFVKQNVSSVPFFPTAKESATSYMQALLSDKPEELIIKDGCLRAGGYLLVWPYGFSLSADNGTFQVIDSTGQIVARVGDKIKVGGGADETPDGRIARGYSAQLPSERCSGPYWIVGEVITVEKSTSPVATTPQIKTGIWGSEEKMLVVGGTWEKDGWNLSVKAVDKTATPGFILISLSYQDKNLGDARIETGKSYTYKGRNPDGSEAALFTIKASIFVGASVDAVRLALNWSIPESDVQIIEAPVESEMQTETPVPTPTAQASPEAPGFGMVFGIAGVLAVWRRLKK